MEEELNEQDLEERLYDMIHHVDQTQTNVITNQNTFQIIENAPHSTIRRYWRTSGENNPYQKNNTSSESSGNRNIIQNTKQVVNVTNKNATPKPNENKNMPNTKQNENKNLQFSKQNENNTGTVKQTKDNQIATKPKEEEEEKSKSPQPTVDLSLFQTPPQKCKKVIEILDHVIDNQVILESSDEDEVIEVELPPKPTITIESSDEDELEIIKPDTEVSAQQKQEEKTTERDISASPVPSVVSSISDEFIRGDCIALKISSRHPNNQSFDFNLHGSDLLQKTTQSKKKKKKKNKEAVTSTPIVHTPEKTVSDECFATPKGKAKNKKPKSKTYTVSNNSVPCVDVYDSDSNQSAVDNSKNNSYVVTEKSLPNTDVYESDSSQSETVKEKPNRPITNLNSSDSSVSVDQTLKTLSTTKNDTNDVDKTFTDISLVDLTKNDNYTTFDESGICESIVMGNVTGFTEPQYYFDEDINMNQKNTSMFGSTKVPAILNADLDFDNLKGKDKVCRRRRYSLTTLRAEMEKFYNESWGGEDFNHREIQKSMSRDKSLWAIDPKDRMMSPMVKKKVTCNYCNRSGHRDDTCRMKPPICYMCGSTGHFEPRCPRKICVNCGSPNHMYSSMCSNCRHWGSVTCAECGQNGHPATHCPDLWRRYHNTIDTNTPLQRNQHTKRYQHMFCSGCTKRGHLVHTCRTTIPFSGLPINTPYVCFYRPIYSEVTSNTENTPNNKKNKSISQDSNVSSAGIPRPDNKRQCESPNVHESHVNKKKNTNMPADGTRNANNAPQRKASISDEGSKKNKETPKNVNNDKHGVVDEALDFIPITSSNQDKKGNMIQDNEVSDTSSAITSARIYVSNDVIDKLKTKDGQLWLKAMTEKYDVNVNSDDVIFLNIRGKVPDQESFQIEFKKWAKNKPDKERDTSELEVSKENQTGLCDLGVLPKNRKQLIRTLRNAFESLKNELGDPNAIYKELTFLQDQKQKLLMKKDISAKQVSNNRSHINRQLKALNMVLIGQAGLADGTQHLNELQVLQRKLMNSKEIMISPEERMEILEHYSNIFGPVWRDDYIELLNKYYRAQSIIKKKNKESLLGLKKNNAVSITQPANNDLTDNTSKKTQGDNKSENIKKKLIFFHRRLLRARPNGADLKKKRGELVRRLHSFIASLNANVTSRKLRKIRKIQEQAQMFLVHV